jgi:hypothetical protein
LLFVLCTLLVKAVVRGHGDDAGAGTELRCGSNCVLKLAAARQHNGVKRRGLLDSDVTAGQDAVAANVCRYLGQIGQGLACEGEQSGAVGAGEGGYECSRSFLRVSRANN